MLGGEGRHLAREDVAQHAVALLEHQRLALRWLEQRGAVGPFDPPAVRGRRCREHGCAGAVAEQAGADQNAGIVVEIHRCAAHLDADREHVRRGAGTDQRSRELKVRQRGGAALADEVVGLHVGAQAEPLGDVAREARAKIAGARADDDGADLVGGEPGVDECRAPASAASAGALARKRRSSVSGSIVNTSSSEASASRRASMPLSRCRTVRAIRCDRLSRRANQSERSNASRHSALV